MYKQGHFSSSRPWRSKAWQHWKHSFLIVSLWDDVPDPMSHTGETDVLVTNRRVGGGRTLAENVLHKNTLVQQLIQFQNAQLTGRDFTQPPKEIVIYSWARRPQVTSADHCTGSHGSVEIQEGTTSGGLRELDYKPAYQIVHCKQDQ